jgi:phospholipase/carboxylesterase
MRSSQIAELNVRIAGGSDREGGGTGPVVVLLHGYGAPGDDLVSLHRALRVPSDVRFVFPEAPLAPSDLAAYGGRAWWPLDMVALQQACAEGREHERVLAEPAGMAQARAQVLALLDGVEREFGVTGSQIVLGGFSQGAMLSCDVALHSERALAGLALLSASLLNRDVWRANMPKRKQLPVLQTHGLRDPLLSHALAVELRDLLRQAGVQVEWLEFNGGHELPSPVLEALAGFIAKVT